MISDNLHINTTGIFGKILTVMLIRPASLALLVMGVFYLWLFLRRTAPDPVSEPG
jgi:uncharacterized membrane protein